MAAGAPRQAAWWDLLSTAAEEWRATPFYRVMLRGADPAKVEQWGRDPLPHDPVRGREILNGIWRIGAERLPQPVGAPWGAAHPSATFTARLHSFSWLGDLAAAPGSREAVAALITSWIDTFGEWHEAAWAPELVAERLKAWLCHGRAAFEPANPATYPLLMRSLGRQARHLFHAAKDIRDPLARISAGAALTLAGCAGLGDGSPLLDTGVEMLDEAAAGQFFADGGHMSRAPEALLDALGDFLLADDTLVVAGKEPPQIFAGMSNRLADMLAMLTLGDGGLACFQGGAEGPNGGAARLLDAIGGARRKLSYANQSGYQRLDAGDLVLLMDVGGPPQRDFGARAHAGALAFELSCGADRMIVNVGAGRELDPEWRAAARATNAHSTLSVGDALSAPFARARRLRGGAAYPTGPTVTMKRMQDEDGVWIEGQHDGYRAEFGFMTRRFVFMDHAGRNVRGLDSLVRPVNAGRADSAASVDFTIRFHIHPAVKVEAAAYRMIDLVCPSGARWRFRTDAPEHAVEESVYLGGAVKPQRTSQIVLHGSADPSGSGDEPPNRIRWAFTRLDDA